MTLREELARRLIDVAKPFPMRLAVIEPGFLALADECIRQMEWARRECSGSITEPLPTTHHPYPWPPGSVEIRGVRIHGPKPLTLAPKDWQP